MSIQTNCFISDFATVLEKYNQLEYCYKKLVDELNHNRALLASTDEQMEQLNMLQKEVNRYKRQ